MGSGIIGKFLYFWMFIIGGLFIAKFTGFASDDKAMIWFCLALAGVYIVFQVARYKGQQKRASESAANRAPVKKGQQQKRKKKKRK